MVAVLQNFKPGNTYRKEDIKKTLQAIYAGLGLSKVAKATDLEEFFVLHEAVLTSGGVRKKAFNLIGYNEKTIHAIQQYQANHTG